MRRSMWICVVVLAAALGSGLRADCFPTLKLVTQPAVFPSHAAGPVVWNGSALGVAKFDANSHSVWFALYDTDLNQIGSDAQVVANAPNGIVKLTWNGSEFGVFYQAALPDLLLQRVSAGGQPVGTPIPMAANHLATQEEYDVVWDATRQTYDIVHTIPTGPEGGLWVTTVKPDGTIVIDKNVTFYVASTATPHIAAINGSIGAVWLFDDRIAQQLFFALVDAADHITVVTPVSQNGRLPLFVASSTSFLLIDTAPLTVSTSELRSTRLDASGNIISSDATFLRASGVDIASRSLLWNPTLGEWALVYADTTVGFNLAPGDTHLRRFRIPATVPPSDTLFSPDTLYRDFQANYPITWTGVSYVGSIARALPPGDGSYTWLVRNCPLIAAASAPSLVAVATDVTFIATPSGGSPDFSYAWDFGDLSSGTGAVITHQYAHPGTYTVKLVVTDSAHATSTTTLTVKVVVPRVRAARH